jgi:hypothetical protein
MNANYLMFVAGVALLLTILWRGVASGMMRQYALFYTYISFTLVISALRTAITLIYGHSSVQYYYAFHIPNLVSPPLLVLILLDILRRINPGETRVRTKATVLPILFVLVAVSIIGGRLASVDGDPFYRYQTAALFGQMLACVFVYSKACGRRDLNIGRNLRGILAGIAIMVGLQGLNLSHAFFVGTTLQAFVFLLQFIYFVALAVFTYFLWNYEPLVRIGPDRLERIDRAGEELEKTIKALLTPR